ncbi:hypothetical protein ACIOJE_34395 [Kitasatospora sp. NPDC087861]|uniref:hypothetical protein n=1 Tax=Kitasatospora sp. NPDC087861 TaxID=3364070 RepID=UPI0037FBA400
MKTKKSLIIGVVGVALGLTAGLGGVALAGTPESTARTPYAQAAAVVKADATVVRAKGVVRVDRVDAGRYCVTIADNINWALSVPQATLGPGAKWNGEIRVASGTSGVCGNDPHKLGVYTGVSGAYADQPFNVIIP